MKPVAFAYEAPRSLDDALVLLSHDDAVALAGGQSLVPMLNFRLARPSLIVDLNALAGLDYVRECDGALAIGALTRQVTLERSDLVQRGWPLLRRAVRMIGHPAIRTRGTVGGSVAHADPRAELPVALVALDARLALTSPRETRWVQAREFFRGPMMTVLRQGELLTEVSVPGPLPPGARAAFVERARTHGDFAVAGAAVIHAPGEHAAIALLGAGATPVRAAAAELALLEGTATGEVARLAGRTVEDEYRRALITTLVRRAIEQAGP